MDDAINNTIRLMETQGENLTLRSSYNVAGISFTPKQLAESIKKYMPEFKITYKPDFRQAIADSWPASIDDSIARHDWGLTQEYDLDKMTKLMLEKVEEKLK
ncbi:MAG: NAD-dependent epimerase, partial [Bacteroidetes bacterium]|nr:NAD-dependent epimerase [Bacteroidota bacterium]